ncbi:hypothetical protein PTNB85_10290 [Pyrenophora teres f. teres]|nr:hypothetical protein PTNB85_10290 [Pyrenophora teres f. teres]
MPSFPYFTTMLRTTTPTSTRQLTPPTATSLTLPSTFPALQPVWLPEGTYRICTDESEYADMLTEVEDEDEVAAEEMECTDETVGEKEVVRWDTLYSLDSIATDAEMLDQGEQQVYSPLPLSVPRSSFFGGEVSVECLFDADMPFASDEELFVRSVFDAVAAPCTALGLLEDKDEVVEEVTLLDTSELKLLPSVAVQGFCDPVALWTEAEALPVGGEEEEEEEEEEEVVVKREGRSLIPALSLFSEMEVESVQPELVLDAEAQEQEKKKDSFDLLHTDSTWTLEDDPVLRYITSQTFLPGLDTIAEVVVRSAFIQYDNSDIDALYQATTAFVQDRYDGECACLDDKPAAPRLPGENYLLVDNEGVFGLSVARPRAEDIFELLDAVVDPDEFDDDDDDEEDVLGGEFLYDDDEDDLPRAGVFYDAAAGGMVAFVALDQLLYPTTSIAKYPPSIVLADSQTSHYKFFDDEDHVSDISDSDADDVSMVQSSEWPYFDTNTQQYMGYTTLEYLLQTDQPSELTYFDADSQQYVGYTAFNQLLQIDADQMRPVVHQDFNDLFDQLVEEVAELLQNELDELDETDLPSPQVQTPTRPSRNAPVQGRLRGFQRVGPYKMYSSHQRPTMQSRRNVQLVLQPQQLYDVEEDEDEEEEDCLSPPSSAHLLEFTTHCAVVKTLATRRASFLLDDDEPESSMPSPTSQATEPSTDGQYEHMFADAIWTMSPDLALTNPSHASSSSSIVPVLSWPQHNFPSLPVLEAFGTEIHNHLALIFNCLNTGRSHKLPALSNDLTWALNALVSEYPSMTLLGSLGVAVEILVERMVASSVVA